MSDLKIGDKVSNLGDYYTPEIQEDYSACGHLLPCGICDRTNQICPVQGWKPSWQYDVHWTNFGKSIPCSAEKKDK